MILVKRYAATRLYDVTHARYVTAAEVRDWAAKGVAVSVIDAKTGEAIEVERLPPDKG